MTRPVATYRDRTRQPPTRTLPCRLKRSRNLCATGQPERFEKLDAVSGDLDAGKRAGITGLGDRLVAGQSVARHIAQIKEFAALEAVAPFRDLSRPVASAVAPETPPAPQPIASQQDPAVTPDLSRQGATGAVLLHGMPVEPASEQPVRGGRARRGGRVGSRGGGEVLRAMSRSSSTNSKLPAMTATSCAGRSMAKTAPSRH